MKKEIKNLKGFTLLELLVVVLIIGILASIALPRYEMAVTKAKVASILPIMRRWKDAYAEYKLQHGSYLTEDEDYPDSDTLGVSWPSDWTCDDDRKIACYNDYWSCGSNYDMDEGEVWCQHNNIFGIYMYQPDTSFEDGKNKILCNAVADEGHKICKALGGKLLEEGHGTGYILY